MTTKDDAFLARLFAAADAHAEGNGDGDYATGDLQLIVRAMWRLLTPDQRVAVFAEPEFVELAEAPEYGGLYPVSADEVKPTGRFIMLSPYNLASKFAEQIRRTLTAKDIAEINVLNETDGSPACHSHDYCDPNQLMLDALAELGHAGEYDPADEELGKLISSAWTIAAGAGFDEEAIRTQQHHMSGE